MPTFALVTEGITDQAVIESILTGLFEGPETDDFAVNPLQPLRDATDRTSMATTAGWELVLEYCRSGHFVEAFDFNDFVIVQIDTDQGEHVNFGVPLTAGGNDRPIGDIIEHTIGRVERELGDAVCNKFGDRILYAIAVHSIECWMISLHSDRQVKERTKNYYAHLIKTLARKNLNIEKTYDSYRDAARLFLKIKEIHKAAGSCESMRYFIYMLQRAV